MADNDSTAGNRLICGLCKCGVDILYIYEGESLCPECYSLATIQAKVGEWAVIMPRSSRRRGIGCRNVTGGAIQRTEVRMLAKTDGDDE